MERRACHDCRSYWVTWEQDHPHGCRAFGFKSASLPSRVVEESSGESCALFEPRAPREASDSPPRRDTFERGRS